MVFTPNLTAYFERIGYHGPREPTLGVLNGICAGHVQNIPFENLDVLLGRRIDLDPNAVERKLVHARRGGYCFEQNTLLLHVLDALGYRVQAISARVRFQRPRDFVPPRTHVFLRVELGGESWLVDVGVGGFSLAGALRLVLEQPQETPHDVRRIVAEGRWQGLSERAPDAKLFHQIHFGGAWHDVYEFTLEEMPEIDRELGNWFTSAHPNSHFKSRLTVARATPAGRITLTDRELTFRARDGHADARLLGSESQLLAVLAEHFDLHFPPGTRFECPGLAGLTNP
jgi:N-hydroxyarylamine O-acetyltransferase